MDEWFESAGDELPGLRIGDRFRVRTPEQPSVEDGRVELVIARGAFGSGEHETTDACLRLLESCPIRSEARVLDFGCGTGILAIAALGLGVGSAVCVDNDPQAVNTAEINAGLNRVDDRMTVLCGTLAQVTESGFDLVLGNIHGDILRVEVGTLVSKAGTGAMLILSGIRYEECDEVRRAYRTAGCREISATMMEDYCALLFLKEIVHGPQTNEGMNLRT